MTRVEGVRERETDRPRETVRESERLSGSDKDKERPKEEPASQREKERQREPCSYSLSPEASLRAVSTQLGPLPMGLDLLPKLWHLLPHSLPNPAGHWTYPTCITPLPYIMGGTQLLLIPLPPGSPPCFHSPSTYPNCIYLTVLVLIAYRLVSSTGCQPLEGRDWVCLACPASLHPAQCLMHSRCLINNG